MDTNEHQRLILVVIYPCRVKMSGTEAVRDQTVH